MGRALPPGKQIASAYLEAQFLLAPIHIGKRRAKLITQLELLDECGAQFRARRFGFQQSTLLQPDTLADTAGKWDWSFATA